MAVGPITGAPTAVTGISATRAVGRNASKRLFTVADGVTPHPAAESGAVSATSLATLLSLQEVESPTERDRKARRHAEEMLEELTGLQLDLLGNAHDPQRLTRLSGMIGAVPPASHPGLRSAVASVALRVEVEIARQTADPRAENIPTRE